MLQYTMSPIKTGRLQLQVENGTMRNPELIAGANTIVKALLVVERNISMAATKLLNLDEQKEEKFCRYWHRIVSQEFIQNPKIKEHYENQLATKNFKFDQYMLDIVSITHAYTDRIAKYDTPLLNSPNDTYVRLKPEEIDAFKRFIQVIEDIHYSFFTNPRNGSLQKDQRARLQMLINRRINSESSISCPIQNLKDTLTTVRPPRTSSLQDRINRARS